MQYREFGNTGIKLSALGFGAMRLPMQDEHVDEEKAIAAIQRAYELGVNYFDTAPYYCKKESEIVLGKAVKPFRDKIYLSTKNPIEDDTADGWRRRLENSLKQMDVDKIDFYQVMWGTSWGTYTEKFAIEGGGLGAALKAKEEGLIDHLCFSFHDKVDSLIKLIDTGHFEGATIQYNLLDRGNEEGIAHARENGFGIIIMGPVAGGRLAPDSEALRRLIPGGSKSTPEVALRFVLANPGVTVALSGMSSVQQVEENAATVSREDIVGEEESQRMQAMLEEIKALSDLYCTGCNYCMPCPNGVDIPRNFSAMNYHRVYGLTDYAKRIYNDLAKRKDKEDNPTPATAEECIECGECEEKCPQRIAIVKQLAEVRTALGT